MRSPLVVVTLLLLAPPAFAHIQLDEPTVRYSNSQGELNKACPCGVGVNNRTCTQPPFDDPNRDNSRATTLTAGSVITVRWRETVGHSGRYRIAFDPNGADLADFDSNILIDVPDPGGSAAIPEVQAKIPTAVDACNPLCENRTPS